MLTSKSTRRSTFITWFPQIPPIWSLRASQTWEKPSMRLTAVLNRLSTLLSFTRVSSLTPCLNEVSLRKILITLKSFISPSRPMVSLFFSSLFPHQLLTLPSFQTNIGYALNMHFINRLSPEYGKTAHTNTTRRHAKSSRSSEKDEYRDRSYIHHGASEITLKTLEWCLNPEYRNYYAVVVDGGRRSDQIYCPKTGKFLDFSRNMQRVMNGSKM